MSTGIGAFNKYKEKLPKDQQKVLDKLLERHSSECKKSFIEEIQRDQLHSTIVNICAYAFSESGPLAATGYHFITVDPLYNLRGEKGNKIFDIILYNRESKRTILIECKSSIGEPHRDVFSPLMEQIENVKKHRKELEDEIGGEITDTEYVICGPTHDIEEVGKAIKDEQVCLWTVDLYFFRLKLFNFSGSTDGDQTGKLVKKRQLHIDESLRKRLFEKTESRGQIEGFKIAPTSHICRILSHVLEKIIREIIIITAGQEKRLWLHELVNIVREELPKIDIEDVRRISKELYELALRLKIAEEGKTPDDKNQDLDFILKFSPRYLRTLEKEINERFAEDKCKERSPAKTIQEYKELLKTNMESLDYHFFRTSQSLPAPGGNNASSNAKNDNEEHV